MPESHRSSRDRTFPRRNYFRRTQEHPFEVWKLKENDIKHELPLAAMQCPIMNYHLQQRLLLERRPSSREERRLFSDSSCSNTLLLARSTWLLGGLLFAPSLGHGFLSGRYRKSGIWNTSRERWIFLILCFDWEPRKVQRTAAAMLDPKNQLYRRLTMSKVGKAEESWWITYVVEGTYQLQLVVQWLAEILQQMRRWSIEPCPCRFLAQLSRKGLYDRPSLRATISDLHACNSFGIILGFRVSVFWLLFLSLRKLERRLAGFMQAAMITTHDRKAKKTT